MPLAENEVLTGTATGTTGSDGNAFFGLQNVPSDPTRVKMYVAGLRMTRGTHFALSGQQATFLAPYIPLAGDQPIADYNWELPVLSPSVSATLLPSASAPINFADSLGVDISCWPGLDPLGTYVSGLTALCQRIARRLTTPRGAWFWAPNEGTDVRAYLNESMGQDAQAQVKAAIEREALREEEVATASADVTFTAATFSLVIHLTGTTRTGVTFQFVLGVTSVTIAILKAG